MPMRDVFPTLSMGPLPSPSDLRALLRHGTRHIINVSGAEMNHIYGEALATRFDRQEFFFRDAFTAPLSKEEWEAFCRTELIETHKAIDALVAVLTSGVAVHCFCRQGISRSSVVSGGALIVAFDLSIEDTMSTIRRKNPRAQFSRRAINFLQEISETLVSPVP